MRNYRAPVVIVHPDLGLRATEGPTSCQWRRSALSGMDSASGSMIGTSRRSWSTPRWPLKRATASISPSLERPARDQPVERPDGVVPPHQPPDVAGRPELRRHPKAVDELDVGWPEIADAGGYAVATSSAPGCRVDLEGRHLVRRPARQRVHDVHPAGRPVDDHTMVGHHELEGLHARAEGVRDLRRDEHTVEHVTQVPTSDELRQQLRTHAFRQGLGIGERSIGRQRVRLVRATRRGTMSAWAWHHRAPTTMRRAGVIHRPARTYGPVSAPADIRARSARLRGHTCPVSAPARTYVPGQRACADIRARSDQKIRSPDLRRLRSRATASSRMSAASVSLRRSFT